MLSTTPIRRPAVRQKYALEAIPNEGFLLVGENETHILEGDVFAHVLPLIDGQRTSDEIAGLLSARVPRDQVGNALSFLTTHGHIEESDPGMPIEFGAFWSELGVLDTRQLPLLFANSPVQLLNLSAEPHPGLAATLSSLGLSLSSEGRILVVTVDDYLDPRLGELNQTAVSRGLTWVLTKPDGVNIWIGPLFKPGSSACWACLSTRLRDNREAEEYLRARTRRTGPVQSTRARLWPTRSQAYTSLAIQIAKLIATGTSSVLENGISILETTNLALTHHPVIRRPQCEVCGDPLLLAKQGEVVIRAENARTTFVVDGGERHEPPEITYERFRHHVSPVTGIVRSIVPSPWQYRSPLRSYLAGHNFALKNGSLYFLKDGLRTNSSGKGRTDAQARTSALCEALERYSGVYRGEETRVRASLRDLSDRAIHPNRCMLFSDKQYAERDQWLARASRFQVVPKVFDGDADLDWSPVYSHTEKRVKYLPTSYLYYGYPHEDSKFFCWADSNGNAAGGSLDDACLQALYELVERDAVCVWWYNRLKRPAVELDQTDAYVAELRSFYASIGREFWVLDLTNDIGIPAMAAVNRRVSGPTEDIVMGFGAHLDPTIAVSRALTEMNQFMPAVLDVDSHGNARYAIDDRDTVNWWQTATVENQPYLKPLGAPNAHAMVANATIADRVLECISRLEALGHEVLFLNQTRPDVGLSTIKAIVPGLRHFWARLAPGRLFDVPVRMGWITTPQREEDLNPISMFL